MKGMNGSSNFRSVGGCYNKSFHGTADMYLGGSVLLLKKNTAQVNCDIIF